jgi:hypothetical protein
VVRESTVLLTHLVEGMWNPAYCASDASINAKDFASRLRDIAAELDKAASILSVGERMKYSKEAGTRES